jgi:squalene synthase HpnC
MAVDHYENFPVASVLLPRAVRTDVINLYRFARAADDIADEGDASPALRLQQLREFRRALHHIGEHNDAESVGNSELDKIFLPLGQTIARHRLPLTPLTDLLSAFEQDVQVKRYLNEDSLRDYCRRSANPIGRLLLHLFGQIDEISLQQSDAICTALQRINFLQDIAIDWKKDRIYIPQSDLNAAGVTKQHFEQQISDAAWEAMMQQQIAVCRGLMQHGSPLGRRLKGRFGLEIRLIIQGGLRILERIEAIDGDVFRHRPVLGRSDWIRMLWRAL